MERQVNVDPIEQGIVIAPTELTLFRNNRLGNQRLIESSDHLKRSMAVDVQYAEGLKKEADEKQERLQKYIKDKVNLEFEYNSYLTTSEAYLKLWDDFSNQNIPQSELNSYFLKCFYANSSVVGRLDNIDDKEREKVLMTNRINRSLFVHPRYRAASKFGGKPPYWFKGNSSEWIKRIYDDSNFSDMLRPEDNTDHEAFAKDLGYTEFDSVPDWMESLESRSSLTREEVEKELVEDRQEFASLTEHINQKKEEGDKLADYYFSRYKKAIIKGEEFRSSTLPINPNLPNILAFFHATEDYDEFEIDTWGADPKYSEVKASRVKYSEWLDKYFKSLEKQSVPEEFIALWMERKFGEAGLTMSQPLTQELAGAMSAFNIENEAELKELRDSNKKLYHVLNNDVNPLLRLSSDEEREYLKQFISESVGRPLESIIWEYSYIVARNQYSPESDRQKKSLQDIKRFGGFWLRRNWHWAYDNLAESIKSEYVKPVQEIVEEPQEDEELPTDLQIESDQASQGELSDWDILYSTNRRIEGRGLVPIEGETLDEKESSLDELLLHEGQQVSIKSSSVVNALDWIATLPKEILYMMPKMDVDGEEYTKVKRGPVRLLFRRDADNKQIVFFLHQKKAWHYKF